MRRACSIDVKPRLSVAARGRRGRLALDQRPDRRGDELVDVLAAVETGAQLARGDRQRLEVEEGDPVRRASSAVEHRVEPLARDTRAASPRRAATSRAPSSGSFQLEEVGELVGAEQEDRPLPLRMGAQQVDRARRASSSDDRRRRGTPRARARAASRPGVSTCLWPGAADDHDHDLVEPERAAARRASRATWPLCGGSKAPPKSPITARTRTTPRRPRPSTPRRAPASRRARSSSSSARRGADDAEAALGAQQAPRARLAAAGGRRGSRRRSPSASASAGAGSGTSAKSAASELVDPRARRAGEPEDGDDPVVRDRERRVGLEIDLVQHDDLRQRVEPGAVGGELGVDRPPLLVGAASTRRSRARASARARGGRGTRGRARRPRSRPRSGRERRRRRAGGRRAPRPCRAPAGAS